MNYSVATLLLQSNIPLPSDYDAFACDTAGGAADVSVEQAATKPDLSAAEKRASHSLMTVWKTGDGWIFENVRHNGFLTVSSDYSRGEFYCEKEDGTDILRPLLQAMVECRLIDKGIMVLHSACICKDGKAVAFTAPSGTGKSSRAKCWETHLGATWISGDRPAINPVSAVAYGVPWDGKEQLFVNTSAPLQAIVEVKRSARTYARALTDSQKMNLLATQLLLPMWDTALAQKAFIGMKQMMAHIPMYRLFCDISEQSTKTAYQILFYNQNQIHPEKDGQNMKLKKGFEIIEIAGDYMAIATGDNMASFGGSVVLNDVSAFLLKAMKEPKTKEELLAALMNEYEIDEVTAVADLDIILASFEKIGLMEE